MARQAKGENIACEALCEEKKHSDGICAESCSGICSANYHSSAEEMFRDSCLAGCKLPTPASEHDAETFCQTPFLPSMDQAACEMGAQTVLMCSQEATAAAAPGMHCAAGQKAVYGPHAGCEEGTCKDPTPLCEVVVTGWHCVCAEAGRLFDGKKGTCVAPDADGCKAQRELMITV